MPPKPNLTTAADIIASREIDFVMRFANNWNHLREIIGITRPIKKQPGTLLKSKYAELQLTSGIVGEGEEIPYSKAVVKERFYATLGIEKYRKAVTLESIDNHGYEAAIEMTDDQFLFELQSMVTDRFYQYIKTGTLKSKETDFQMALAMAQGRVKNRWKEMHKGITNIVGFCNILDAYSYLGAANISVQNQFGMSYIENFLGFSKLFLSSEIEAGRVIATPVENIVLYYIDPSESDFAKAGLQYRVDGDTNLLGFHVNADYSTAVSESFAIMGMTLFSQYLDGIAVISFGDIPDDSAYLDSLTIGTLSLSPVFSGDVFNYTATTNNATNTITANALYDSSSVVIMVNDDEIDSGDSVTWNAGENIVKVMVTNGSSTKTYTVKVTKS